jgi:hypothetical protein
MTLAHVLKELHLDPNDYKVEGGPWYHNLAAVDSDPPRNHAHPPVRALTLWSVAIVPGAQGSQELRIRLNDDVCIGTESVRKYAEAPVMTEQVPCTDGAACSSEITYFSSLGKNRADKRLAVSSQLQVSRECSQGVIVEKTFDASYWVASCPFSYNEQVRHNVIADAKEKYPEAYTLFDFDQPHATDGGGPTVGLHFREPESAPKLEMLSVEVDRCNSIVLRSWRPSRSKP